MTVDIDLFGNPISVRFGTRGRPPYEPNERDFNKIKMLLAIGWSNERIAGAVGITQPTLRKYYFQLLKARAFQRDMMDAERMTKLFTLGMAGNIGAIKEFDRLLEKNDAMEAQRGFASRPAPKEDPKPSEEKVGKKELAQREAEQTALDGGEWGADLAFRGRSVQ